MLTLPPRIETRRNVPFRSRSGDAVPPAKTTGVRRAGRPRSAGRSATRRKRRRCSGQCGQFVEAGLLGRGDARARPSATACCSKLIRADPDIHLRRRSDPFTTLARAIVGQQISVKAADSIWRRFVATVAPGARSPVFPRLDPGAVAATGVAGAADLRAVRSARPSTCAISPPTSPRASSIRSVEEARRRGADPALVEVKGIGRWTAEMFLIFHELRADVLPVDDIGLQRAIALHYNGGGESRPRRSASSRAAGSRTGAWRRGICGDRSTRFRSSTEVVGRRDALPRYDLTDAPNPIDDASRIPMPS